MTATYEFEDWFVKYREAVLETDYVELPKKIAAARAVIIHRREHLKMTDENSDERRALHDALSSLGVLGSEVSKGKNV
jgi:hypothetical protein